MAQAAGERVGRQAHACVAPQRLTHPPPLPPPFLSPSPCSVFVWLEDADEEEEEEDAIDGIVRPDNRAKLR